MSKQHRFRLWGLSSLNACIMLVITFLWLGMTYTFDDEAFFIKWTALTKKSLLGFDPKPDPEEVLFVDISMSKTVINQPNEAGMLSPYHRLVVTDRGHLTEFLEMIRPFREETRLVVLDVLLDQPTEQDSSLQTAVDALGDKLLGITHYTKETGLLPSVIAFNQQAVATYRTTQGMFMKYPLLFQDSVKTVPLSMYELLQSDALDRSGWFYRLQRGISLPNPIVDYKVRKSDFRVGSNLGESNFTIWKMGSLLEYQALLPPEMQAEFFRDRIVLIGDFANDLHTTPFGISPGPLLIYNAYLSLEEGNSIVSLWWILLLFIGYWIISWRAFNDIEIEPPQWLAKSLDSRVGRLVLNTIDDAFLLVLLTVLSYFFFNIHITILILLLYIKAAEFCWNQYVKFKTRKRSYHENATA